MEKKDAGDDLSQEGHLTDAAKKNLEIVQGRLLGEGAVNANRDTPFTKKEHGLDFCKGRTRA